MKFFGCDVNEFSREELLALVDWFGNEIQRVKKNTERDKEVCFDLNYLANRRV